MRIFVIHHREPVPVYPDGYLPMLVGAASSDSSLKEYCLTDNTLDHISFKNNSYCELTGLYWIWKNCTDEYVGLTHYRRFFLGGNKLKRISFRDRIYMFDPNNTSACHILRTEEAARLLTHADFIVKKSRWYHWDLRSKYLDCVPAECLNCLEQVIRTEYPEINTAFQRYLKKHSQILWNMFIGKKSQLDQYCSWLFPLLDKVDEQHFRTCGEHYHNREIGYLGELLFGFWLAQHNVKLKKIDAVFPKHSPVSTIEGIPIEGGSNIYPITF